MKDLVPSLLCGLWLAAPTTAQDSGLVKKRLETTLPKEWSNVWASTVKDTVMVIATVKDGTNAYTNTVLFSTKDKSVNIVVSDRRTGQPVLGAGFPAGQPANIVCLPIFERRQAFFEGKAKQLRDHVLKAVE